MRMLHKLFPLVCLVALPSVAMAADYQAELTGYYSTDTESDVDWLGAGGTYHWQKVSTAGNPLAEAAFLERIGGVSVTMNRADSDFGTFDIWALSANHYFDSGLYLAAGYAMPEEGDNTWGASVGFVPVDGLLLTVDAHEDGNDDVDYSGSAKYVGKLAGDTAWGARLSVDDESYSVGGDYYFSAAFNVGASVSMSDDGDYGAATLNVKYFFTPNVWTAAHYATDVVGDADTSAWGLAAGIRF
jgi:hypothetical protein